MTTELFDLRTNPWKLWMDRYQTDDVCLEIVQLNWQVLHLVKHQTYDICLAAIQQHPDAINLVKKEQLTDNEYAMLLLRCN